MTWWKRQQCQDMTLNIGNDTKQLGWNAGSKKRNEKCAKIKRIRITDKPSMHKRISELIQQMTYSSRGCIMSKKKHY